MKASHYLTLLFFIISGYTVNAQTIISEQLTDDDSDDTLGVVLHADPRINTVLKNQRNVQVGYIYSGKGYRVQIYCGNDRVKANEIKIDFIRHYPSIHTYLTYIQPQFRVKVGDFRTRAEAEKLFEETNTLYGASIIVPDIVVINNFKDD
jgi:hypothetical protein